MFDKPIIFLDYDGVVNNPITDSSGNVINFSYLKDGSVNNHRAIFWLNEMYKICQYDIVVSSSWRVFPNYKNCLYNGGLNPEIKVIGATPFDRKKYKNRGEEISSWLAENNFSLRFAIVDDEIITGDLVQYLILCNSDYGFENVVMNKVLKKIKE